MTPASRIGSEVMSPVEGRTVFPADGGVLVEEVGLLEVVDGSVEVDELEVGGADSALFVTLT